MNRPLLAGSLLLLVSIATSAAQTSASSSQTGTVAGKTPTPPPGPFPGAEDLDKRRRDAESLPLFRSDEVLAFTLTADFKAVFRDRNTESTVTFPATLAFTQLDGTTVSKPIQLRGRGHSRRGFNDRGLATCEFTPLRLELTKPLMAGTVFADQNALKLGTHCWNTPQFEQVVLREYSAYRIFNLLTPRSFRARLARGTYVDAASRRPIAERFAMFLEDEDDVAKRMGGRIDERRVFGFSRLDAEQLTLVMLFEHMIGNTDLAVRSQHNVNVVETPSLAAYPIPYDFDYAGLVNAPYAVVDRARVKGISTVRERLYLGPCRTLAELEPILARFRAARADIDALYASLPGLLDASRKDVTSYLDGFHRVIDQPDAVKRAFVDRCRQDF